MQLLPTACPHRLNQDACRWCEKHPACSSQPCMLLPVVWSSA